MLLNDAQNAYERLKLAENASTKVEEAEILSTKRNELQQLADRISDLAHRSAFLSEAKVRLTPPPEIDKLKQMISQNMSRFVESPTALTLVEKKRWTNLVSKLTEYAASTGTLQSQDWKMHFNTKLFAGLAPDQQQQTILRALPQNQTSMSRYRDLYQRLGQFRNTVPATADALHNAVKCSEELEKISIQFVKNDAVPSEVKAFFDATSTAGGARLEMLTSSVVEWLCTNNMLDNYVIRAR